MRRMKYFTTVLAASMLFSSMAIGINADAIKAEHSKASDEGQVAVEADLAVDINESWNLNDTASWRADYTSVTFTSAMGDTAVVSVSGSTVSVTSSATTQVVIAVVDSNNRSAGSQSGSTSATLDLAGVIDANERCALGVKMVFPCNTIQDEGLSISIDNSGNAYFVKSPVYDFNVERCSELWTDATSLEECLLPQPDSDCTDPVIIAKAEEIIASANASTDFEKAYAIYRYIVDEMAYDYAQVQDPYTVYQDDTLTLLRTNVAICEGFGNVFTALCRAVGVPAAVSFGIGDDMWNTQYETDEGPNHAWAVVCLGGQWYHLDPTWDNWNEYNGMTIIYGDATTDWYLTPLESFSSTHKICDADTLHGIESTGSCGPSATYSISRDGVCTISGSGVVTMPYGVNGFHTLVFDEDCTVTSIGEESFVDCDVLTTVILPETVTRIEDYAFCTCEDLYYVYLPEGLEYIGQSAFDTCDELTYVYVPDSVTTIGTWAFDLCGRLILSIPEDLNLGMSNYYAEPYRIIERES